MGSFTEQEDSKVDAAHIEKLSTSSLDETENIDDLDSIEQTQSGKYAWLVAITAGVGGFLFGRYRVVGVQEFLVTNLVFRL